MPGNTKHAAFSQYKGSNLYISDNSYHPVTVTNMVTRSIKHTEVSQKLEANGDNGYQKFEHTLSR